MLYTPSIFDDRLMDNFFEGFLDRPSWTPAVKGGIMRTDITEKDGNYHMEIELPGYKKENIQAELKDGYLTISAQKNVENDEKNEEGKYIRRERYTGSQSRSFYVGEHLTEEDIHASFEDGILKLTIPKEEQKVVEEKRHFVQIEG